MACQNPLSLSSLLPSPSKPYRSVLSPSPLLLSRSRIFSFHPISSNFSLSSPLHHSFPRRRQSVPISSPRFLCKTVEYVFPDPIPEFAETETSKFRAHLLERLAKKDIFGDSLDEIVQICTEILSNFLHTEYGGPGTLLVIPFIDMADTINERGLPGGPQAARAAVVWAQNHIDKDWKDWTGDPNL